MLPLILFPFLVIASLAALLYLFFRKLPEVEARSRLLSGESPPLLTSLGYSIKRVFLRLVEWLAWFFKFFFLKIHTRLSALALRAREARLRTASKITDRALRKSSRPERFHAMPAPFPSTSPQEESDTVDVALTPRSESLPQSHDSSALRSALPVAPDSSGASDRASLRKWFGKDREEGGSLSKNMDERGASSESGAPLVSEALDPIVPKEVALRRRAAHVSRKFGDAVRRLGIERRPLSGEQQVVSEPLKKKEQLEDILVERISLNPRDIEAYERLGDYYLEQGTLVDAKECYRQVLKLSPAYRLVKIKIRRLERLLEKERVS